MSIYRHRQTGMALQWGLGAAAVVLAAVVYANTGSLPGAAAVAALVVLTNLLFSSLTVEVDGREVTAAFGIGLIRKRFPVADIVEVRPVRNSWWYGWGIRLTPHGWLYNVAGLDAVELELLGERKVRIGTDEPEALAAAVRRAAGRP